MKTSQGVISESSAIIQYLADTHKPELHGIDAFSRAQVKQWVEFTNNEIKMHMKNVIYPLFGWAEFNKTDNENSSKALKEHFKLLEKHIAGKDYFVGSQVTLADLTLWVSLRFFFTFIYVEEVRKNLFPHLTKWFVGLANETHAIKTFGRTLLCKTPIKAPKVEKKEEKEKKEKKQDKPKKEEKADDEEEKPKKKQANPLDLLPPSPLVLDEFKKEFLNSADKPGVLAEFWKKYDPTGYSLWFLQYQRLPTEGKILFKTNNSSNFFLQKLDHFRKYSFSAHGVYGVEGDYEVRGVWMWRGTDIPAEIKDHDSFPYTTIRKLDHTVDADRQLVNDYWLNL